MRTPKTIHFIVVAVLGCSLCLSARAITVSGLVETPDSLTFNFFTEDSHGPVIDLPPLTYWSWIGEGHGSHNGEYSFTVFFQHLPDGPDAEVGEPGWVPFGQTISDTAVVAHGTGMDTFNLTATVNESETGGGVWGKVTGSFSAIHTVPDASATGALLVLAFFAVAAIQRTKPLYRRTRTS